MELEIVATQMPWVLAFPFQIFIQYKSNNFNGFQVNLCSGLAIEYKILANISKY